MAALVGRRAGRAAQRRAWSPSSVIPALVVTIGTQFLYRGLTLALVSGKSYALVETRHSTAYRLLDGRLLGIPMQFVWLVLVAIVTWLLLFRHRLGQNGHVIGDNRQAAQLMGIPIRRTRILLFVLVGIASAFAGAMKSLQVSNFYPAMGAGYLLPALAAVFVGGHVGVRGPRHRLGNVRRGVHDRCDPGGDRGGRADATTGPR